MDEDADGSAAQAIGKGTPAILLKVGIQSTVGRDKKKKNPHFSA